MPVTMPKASEVAAALRKLADAMDRSPDMLIHKPSVYISCQTKEEFIRSVSVMPRPLTKREDTSGPESIRRIHLEHDTEALDIDCNVYQHLVCELVEPARPAVFRCVPILSLEEEAAL